MSAFSSTRFFDYLPGVIVPAVVATFRMLAVSFVLGLLLGVVTAVWLVVTAPRGLRPNRSVYKALNFAISAVRSFPVIILIVAITPLTRLLVGTSIGESAAIVPMTLAVFPIIARAIEVSLNDVDPAVVRAARSFGASDRQIVAKVLFVEALPGIVSGLTSTLIILLGYTTVAGAVGAGGLGAVALTYGYQRFDDVMMYAIVLVLFLVVLAIQAAGGTLYKMTRSERA